MCDAFIGRFCRLSRFGIGVPLAMAAVSCGGGGGGSGSGVTPLVYSGSTDPAILTTANAAQLLVDVIGSNNAVAILAEDPDGREVPPPARSFGIVELARRLGGAVARDAIAARLEESARRVDALSIPIDDTEPCGDGYIRTFGLLSDDGLGTLTIVYANCTMGDETLDGTASLRIDEFDMSSFVPVRFTESFARLFLHTTDFAGALGGRLQYVVDLAADTETITADFVTLDSATGRMMKSDGLVLVDAYDDLLAPTRLDEEVYGRLFDSTEGYVDLSSPDSLRFATLEQEFPNEGSLRLQAVANASILATAVSASRVLAELDLDGDGSHELGTTIGWNDLTAGASIDFERPSAPDVTATVNGDGSVTLDWTPSTDASGIAEYRVLRGLVLVGRVTGTSFTDRGAEPGRTLDYRVRAVDNAGNLSTRVASQSVVVPSSGSASFDPPVTGDLDFSPSSDGIGLAVDDVDGDGTRDLVATGGSAIDTALGPLATGLSFSSSSVYFPTLANDANLPFFALADQVGDGSPEAFGSANTLTWDLAGSKWKEVNGSGAPPGYEPAAFADVDDDGVLDAISVGSGFTPTILTVLGDADGGFDPTSSRDLVDPGGFSWTAIGRIAAADFDRDGLTDLLIWDADRLRLAHQAKRGAFELTAALPVVDQRYTRDALHVGDVTGDGFTDIVVANYAGGASELRVHVNDGAGGFSEDSVASGVAKPWNFRSADLDGDGREDLAVANQSGTAVDLWHSNGDGTFSILSSIAITGFPFLELADVDRDGDVDLVTGGVFGSKTVSLYLNH